MANTMWLLVISALVVVQRVFSQEYRIYATVFTQSNKWETKQMKLFLASSRSHDVYVEVEVPFFPSPVPYKNVTLSPGERTIISLPADIQMPTGSLTSNRVVRVLADDDITVIVLNEEGSNADIYQVKESGMLGTEYVLPSQVFKTVGSTVTVGVASPWSNYTLQVKLPVSITSIQATVNGVTQTLQREFVVTLQKNNALQIQSVTDLAGTTIHSDKPIAVVFGVNRTTSVTDTCLDSQITQLYSVDKLGTKYIVFGYKESDAQDNVHILSIHPNTSVTFEGSTTVLANAGDDLLLHINRNQFRLLETSVPALVVMATRSGKNGVSGDNSLSSLTSLPLTGLQFTITIPTGNFVTAKIYLVLMIESSGVDDILLDGVAITGVTWTEVAGTNICAGYYHITDNGNPRVVKHRYFRPLAVYLHKYSSCTGYSMMFEPYENDVLEIKPAGNVCAWDRRSVTVFEGKRMTSERIRSCAVEGDFTCKLLCMKYRDCLGVNFSASVTPGDSNCELLFGETSGESINPIWTFYGIAPNN